jgi:hypothetical protein
MSGNNDNFFLNFLSLARGTEIPELFALWSGVGAASAMLGRRIWIDMGSYTVFPNVYVLLVASSGRHRKSSSLNLALDLIHELPLKPNIIPQKITPEALIDALREGAPNGKIAAAHEGFVFASEFNTFFNRKAYEAGLGAMLTDFWDCPKVWEYRTKGRGVEQLELTCFGLLGASTIEFLREAIPEDAIGSGFTSRCVFVYSKDPPPPVARTTFDQAKLATRERVKKNLERLATLNGPATLTEEAWKVYEEEYYRWHKQAEEFWNNKTLEGYASRRNVHWLKLGLIFAATDGVLQIEARHLRGSLVILQNAEKHMKIVTAELTTSDIGRFIGQVLAFIKARRKATKAEIISVMMHSLSAKQLTEVLDTLVASGQVKLHLIDNGVYYVYESKE